LEALRTIADLDPKLFQEIYQFCRDHYEEDKVSYHVSALLTRAPLPSEVKNWVTILDNFDAREILHVTFGSVLKEKSSDGTYQFFDRLIRILKDNPDAYAQNIEQHFLRHLTPFIEKDN
jgi:hypothetical protein